jgi:hypothetical protein
LFRARSPLNFFIIIIIEQYDLEILI